jgi:hypothetical protein
LEYYLNIEIVHENQGIFINLKDDEIPLLEEYKRWLSEFQNL